VSIPLDPFSEATTNLESESILLRNTQEKPKRKGGKQ
jgi:hypothetical protein